MMTRVSELSRGTLPKVRALTPEDFGIGQLFSAIRDAVVVGDTETGRIVLWNPAAEELFGATAAEAVGQPIETLVPQSLRKRHRAGLAHFSETGGGPLIDTGQPVELPALRWSGEQITIELTLSPLAVCAVPGHFVLAIIRDATMRKRAEADRLRLAGEQVAHDAAVQAETALRQSEERFRTAFEHTAVGMALVGLDGRLLQVNGALCALMGYTAPALLSMTLQDITHPHDLEADLVQADQLLAGEIRAYQIEKRYVRKDGDVVWARLSSSLVRDEHGSPMHGIDIIEDITARKLAEEDLLVSRAKYRSLVEQLPAVVYILAADEIQTPLYFSPYIEELTGETPEEAVAFREHWLQLVHPEDRERVAAEEVRTAALGTIFRGEYRHLRKDGNYVWIRDECVPLRDEKETIIAWQGVMLDISERVRLEAAEAETRAREEQRDQLRIILDHLPAGVLILTGPDGEVEQANTAARHMIFGATGVPDMLPVYGRDFRFLRLDGTPISDELRPGYRALRGEVVDHEQLLLERQDGHRVPVLAHAAALPDTSGQSARAVLVQQDVTRLREAEQLKDDFLSLVSHEIRSPLTTIHGGAHLLINQGEDLDRQTRLELLRDIVEESDRLDRMLANMLVLTEVMAGRLAAKLEPIPVEQLVRTAATSVAARAGNHTFHLSVAPDLPPADGDHALLSHVMINLYQNAVKYAPAGGEIRTTITFDSREVSINVSDQGTGIRSDEIDRVFERFYRAGSDVSVRGTGLGLYLSRLLVNVQGGQIRASSPGLGEGTTFTVTLPIAADWMAVAEMEMIT